VTEKPELDLEPLGPTGPEPAVPEAEKAPGAEPGAEPSEDGARAASEEAAEAEQPVAAEEPAVAEEPAAPEQPAEEAEPDYKDLYLRAVAETENVRKRARRDVALADARGVARLARELLPALDNFERALAAAEAEEADEEHHLTKGIRLVQNELLASLTRVGIEPFSPKGERFDPHQHEAMAQQPVEGVEPGTVVEVYQAGYRYRDDILRPAKVVVAG
jgi:molecular chaperone GrpE